MKRLITLLFLLAGIAFTHSAFAQTANPKKKESGKADSVAAPSAQKSAAPANNQGGAGITIDESGAPKAKIKSPASSNSQKSESPAPKEEAKESKAQAPQKSAEKDEASPPAPDDIAIDESGSVKVKRKPAATKETSSPASVDSTIAAPASQVVRPQ